MWSTPKKKLSSRDRLDLWYMTKTKHDNDVIERAGVVYIKTVLNCHDLSDQVRFVRKTKQDNDMINRISAVYVKNETKLS